MYFYDHSISCGCAGCNEDIPILKTPESYITDRITYYPKTRYQKPRVKWARLATRLLRGPLLIALLAYPAFI